jgi:hypothetical protein
LKESFGITIHIQLTQYGWNYSQEEKTSREKKYDTLRGGHLRVLGEFKF